MEKTWNIRFIDGNKKIVKMEIEYREDMNNRPEFAFTAECCGSMGQCDASIAFVGEEQLRLKEMWDMYHCVSCKVKINFGDDLIGEIYDELTDLQSTLEDAWGDETFDRIPYDVAKEILDEAEVSDTELAYFLACLEELPISSVDDIVEPTRGRANDWSIAGVGYLAGTDGEMDVLWDEGLDNFIDEYILHEIPETYRYYFDEALWKRDAKQDGRANSLGRYDGNEHSQKVNDNYYYAYRT